MRRLAAVPVFALSAFLGAALLFLVEPMVGKMVLPLLGGSASVWTTCMLFFQAGLLAGYAYAHLLGTRLPARAQAAVHLAVVLLAFLALPLSRGVLVPPEGSSAPVAWLLSALTVLVGAPFFALAATGPLLQRWLHGALPARDPYFLYAASNLGSFAGLLAYPLLVERLLPIEGTAGAWSQSRLFSTAFAVFAATIVASAVLARTAGSETSPRTEALSWRRRGLFVLLAFIPSSAVLGVTQYVTAEIAPVPLLWVVPLAIYLATFVVAFSPRISIGPWSGLALAVTTASVAACMMPAVRSGGHLLVLVHFAALAAVGLALHGRLAAMRPEPGRLTEFYLWIAVGGVAGGIWNAVVAPLVFKSIAEYPVALVLAALVRPLWPDDRAEPRRPLSYALDVVVPIAIAAFAIVARGTETASPVAPGWPAMTVQAIVPALLCLGAAGWRVRFALSLGALLLVGWWETAAPQTSLDRERTFYGVHRVVPSYAGEAPARVAFHMLIHGATRHGLQAVDPDRRRTPTTYYHRSGPFGQAWETLALDRAKEIGIVGLGAGTIAAYGSTGQHFTYFEIDPAVARIARDPRYFTYLADSAAEVDVTLGDGRLALGRTADGSFDVLVLDAFSSDAIPVHLLTREAIALALRKLAPDGVLLLHLTNHYLRLEEVVDAIARDLGANAFLEGDRAMTDAWTIEGKEPSTWAILARSRDRLAPLADDPRWTPMPLPPHPGAKNVLWTDDRSDLFTVLRHF